MADKVALASLQENNQIARAVLLWLNSCGFLPVEKLDFEYLPSDKSGVMISTVQTAYITKQYFAGYTGRYQFNIFYRAMCGNSTVKRLEADSTVDCLADWCCSNSASLNLGDGLNVISVKCDTRSALIARYDDGTEDHSALVTVNYSKIN